MATNGLHWIWRSVNNYIHYKVCDEITYPFPNFSNAALKFKKGWVILISFHTLLGKWLLIHTEIKSVFVKESPVAPFTNMV